MRKNLLRKYLSFKREVSLGLPLVLTLIRIVLSPLFLIFYLYYESMGIPFEILPFVLLFILSICEVSDFLDGFLARKRNKVTDLGKILDPMADSIFRLSVFFTFTQGVVQLPLLLVFVFFFRESVISSLRTLCALRGEALAARLSGKVKAILQAITVFFILLLMIPYTWGTLPLESFRQMSLYAAYIAAIYTVISGIEYGWSNRAHIKKTLVSVSKR